MGASPGPPPGQGVGMGVGVKPAGVGVGLGAKPGGVGLGAESASPGGERQSQESQRSKLGLDERAKLVNPKILEEEMARVAAEDEQMKALEHEKERINSQIEGRSRVEHEALLDMELERMGLHDPSIFHKKMKGFNLAFNNHAEAHRIEESDPSRSYVYRPPKGMRTEDIKREVENIK